MMRQRRASWIICLASLLLAALSLLFFAFCLPPQYEKTYLGGFSGKWEALNEAPSPKIVLVGGSGTAFNARCDLIEQELPGYSAVNFGLYAGLGTTVMLDAAKACLREGDIVVFWPEISEQTLSLYFNAEAMGQAADGCFRPVFLLGEEYRKPLAGAFISFAAAKAGYWFGNNAPAGEGIYSAASFNRYGDIDSPGR